MLMHIPCIYWSGNKGSLESLLDVVLLEQHIKEHLTEADTGERMFC